MDVHELLDRVVVVAQRKHLVYEEHQAEVAGGLLEVWFHLEFFLELTCWQLHQVSSNVHALYGSHGEQEVFNQKSLLDLYRKSAEVLGSLVCQMTLQLSPVLLVLLNKRLVLVCDVVVVQERTFEQPVRQVRDCRTHQFKSAVFIDVLAVRTKQKVLLDLAVLAKRTF